jgi:hypothetical protein
MLNRRYAPGGIAMLMPKNGSTIQSSVGFSMVGVNDRDLWFPVIPGYAELIPGSPQKRPGSLATGISFQPVDSAHVFFARIEAFEIESKKFPVKFAIAPALREFHSAEAGRPRCR